MTSTLPEGKIQKDGRLSAAKRGYGHLWRKARADYLVKNPKCAECGEPSTVVDHVKPHGGNKKRFWDKKNWCALCKTCHDTKTASRDGGFGNKKHSELPETFAEGFHPYALKYTKATQFESAEAAFYRVVVNQLTGYADAAIQAFGLLSFAEIAEIEAEVEKYLRGLEPFENVFLRSLEAELGTAEKQAISLGLNAANRELRIDLDYDVDMPEAQAFARANAVELAKGITDSTKARMGTAIRDGMAKGESRDDIAKRLQAIKADIPDWRAKLISQTETIRAYTGGKLLYYRQAGVDRVEWLDGQQGACEICKMHHGQETGIGEPFESSMGTYPGPPAHPGCRCTTAPVIGEPKVKVQESLPLSRRRRQSVSDEYPEDGFDDHKSIRDWMRRKYKGITWGLYKESLDLNASNTIARELDRLLTKYPKVQEHLKMVTEMPPGDWREGGRHSQAYAYMVNDGTMAFNPKYWKDSYRGESLYRRDMKNGFHPDNGKSPLAQIVTHEFGHALDTVYRRTLSSKHFGIFSNIMNRLADKVVANRISKYAKENEAEAWAEAFVLVDAGVTAPIMAIRPLLADMENLTNENR